MVLDKEQIQKEAKKLLDKFTLALEEVDKHRKETEVSLTSQPSLYVVDREEFEREEGKGREYDSKFKNKFLQNSPAHDDDLIITERGSWK